MDILLLAFALMIGGDDPAPLPPPPPQIQQCGKQPDGTYVYCTVIVPQQ